jgi:hypothetical protein
MKYELALVSPVFFCYLILFPLTWLFRTVGDLAFDAVLVSISMISFIGSILLLISARNNSSRYYWLLPLSLTIFAVITVEVAGFFLKLFTYDTSVMLSGITVLLLAPCSLMVFFSLPLPGKVRSASIYLAAFVSAYVGITAYFILIAGFIPALVLPYLYWIIGMPIIGICYLACAVVSPKTASSSS